MAMTKTLWSISALAVEFGIDRRTVAKRINHIKHASKAGEPKQWFLSDVVGALTTQPLDEKQGDHPFVDKLSERLSGWEDICSKPQYEVTLAFFAEMIGQEPQIVLNQLRAGMPCKAECDWSTGEGSHPNTSRPVPSLVLRTGLAVDFVRERSGTNKLLRKTDRAPHQLQFSAFGE